MTFIVSNGLGLYVKRTCTRYGPFYGRLVVTNQRGDARQWTRCNDAVAMARVIAAQSCSLYSSIAKRPLEFIEESGEVLVECTDDGLVKMCIQYLPRKK